MTHVEQWMRDAMTAMHKIAECELAEGETECHHPECMSALKKGAEIIASEYEKAQGSMLGNIAELREADAPATPATPKWGGTQQRDDLKPCPFCGTRAISQGRLADNSTEQQWRILCGNPFCTMQCVTYTCASFSDAVRNWESRVAEAAPTTPCTDCDEAARHAYSDATTPGFFSPKCNKHAPIPNRCPDCFKDHMPSDYHAGDENSHAPTTSHCTCLCHADGTLCAQCCDGGAGQARKP